MSVRAILFLSIVILNHLWNWYRGNERRGQGGGISFFFILASLRVILHDAIVVFRGCFYNRLFAIIGILLYLHVALFMILMVIWCWLMCPVKIIVEVILLFVT
jgi:hypothetical protein